jgi:hypothetical protein
VILSARELAAGSGRRSAAVFAIVLYDACLVEPVAVRAALWSWNEPGLFGVPPIGILGWAYFAVSTSWLLDRVHGASRLAILVLAPLATHAMLLATWWGALRWIGRGEIPASAAAASAFGIAVVLAIFVRRSGKSAPLSVMAPRMAAAALFFTLLFWRGSDLLPLVVYGSSFAIPYLAATQWAVET